MSDITEVYSKETYLPFIRYCQQHQYKTMADLEKCPFHLLSGEPGFSTLLVSRIKSVYISFCKTLPKESAAAVKAENYRRPQTSKAMTEPELVIFLRKYFEENCEKLITLNDAAKAVEGRAKRTDISKILQQVIWCRPVDKATFFYAPVK
ncbi:hypothetical protein V6615_06805 [Oscillospiraceae bacterium PP1C4]